MIEAISDAVQVLVLTVSLGLSLMRALSPRNTAWLSLACFFSCMLFGDAYYFGYQMLFGETPHYSVIADVSWIASYLFLLMLLIECHQQRPISAPVPAAWIPVVVCVACGIYYTVSFGDLLINIADNGLLAAIGYFAVLGLVAQPTKGLAGNRLFYAAILFFIAVEQAVWLSSCFIDWAALGATLIPYVVSNYVLSLSMALILACAWRSDAT